MTIFQSFRGTVTMIENDWSDSRHQNNCNRIVYVDGEDGTPASFLLTPHTYVLNQDIINVGNSITGFYDANAPVPLIYPPRYEALVMTRNYRGIAVTVDFFNHNLTNPSNTLTLQLSPRTDVLLINGQPFSGNISYRNLIVIYSQPSKDMSFIITPQKIIVLC